MEETVVPAGYSSEVEPFYLTAPQITGTAAKATNFEYNITVQPKNKDLTSEITKSADTTKTVGAGDDISYTITSRVNKKKVGNKAVQ